MKRLWILALLLIFPLLPIPCRCTETQPTESTEISAEEISGPGLFFGLLHSHSSLSSGTQTPEELYARAAAEGLDFFAITDASHSFDNADSAAIGLDATSLSADWAAGKAAAQAATDRDFVAIFGYEMSWKNGLGHMGTFATPGFQSWKQDAFQDYRTGLQNYYEALLSVPEAIGQFQNPGLIHGDFRDFSFYTPEYDSRITLLEVGSPDLPEDHSFYDRALELGWHVAPTNNNGDSGGRTVIYADSLTEEALYDALRNCRAYATRDPDLSIYYSMDGHFMGSRLKQWAVGETADILVTLSDPTDAIGTLEVIGEQGISLAKQTLEASWATVEFSLPADQRYYYLKVTQPDGDVAVTAPIWLEGEEYAGIAGFSSLTDLPVQGQALELALEVYNNENALLSLKEVRITVDGQDALTLPLSRDLLCGQRQSFPVSLTCDAVGPTEIAVTVTASLNGAERIYSQSLNLSFRKDGIVTRLLVDGTHGNTESYPQLSALAVNNQVAVTVEREAITPELLEEAGILLIGPPTESFSAEFMENVRQYLDYGGLLLLCGGSEKQNRLLEYLGASLRFGKTSEETTVFETWNTASVWCENLLPGQLYQGGGPLSAGSGSWIVENVLAVEGRIFAGSGSWLSDEALRDPDNLWDPPTVNRTVVQTILGSAEKQLPLSRIADLRTAEEGTLCRIRGYATSGNTKAGNTFENTVYLQDDTGGIAVTPLSAPEIAVGTPLEILGTVGRQEKNVVIIPISCQILDVAAYRWTPVSAPWDQLMNNALHGGDLAEIQGRVVSFVPWGENGLSELVLEDGSGNYATVSIADSIVSGATGRNDLGEFVAVGRTFRAIGFVHMRSDGTSVLRVRNCDEVVYVPSLNYYWLPTVPDNPNVGDGILLWLLGLLLSGSILLILCKPRCNS